MEAEEPAREAPAAEKHSFAAPRRGSVRHHIVLEEGYLRAELFNRQTVEETRGFLDAVLSEALRHRLPLVLIWVRNSVPIFTIERYGFSTYLEYAFRSKYRIALVGDTVELRIAHQYITTIARMRGVNVRAFAGEASAIAWLRSADAATPPAGGG